ncbi:MAG: NifU family protein [Ignavibacteriales bacterium]|nr:NifU family protein [Ignavibacteriales bacterium]
MKNNVLKIHYQCACGSCPRAIRGTLVAIENLLKKEVSEDIDVISK